MILTQRPDGAIVVILSQSVRCAGCGVAAMLVVNAGGKTSCAHCAPKVKS